MAKKILKQKALLLRKQGKSYSQIRAEINVSKSTLSLWLQGLPLSDKKIRELRDFNASRIERYRTTMANKRLSKLETFLSIADKKIRTLSDRDIFIGGIFLYFGEGSKTTKNTTAVTNTNPYILKFFIKWLTLHKVDSKKLKVKLHLYSDMNIQEEIRYWSKTLSLGVKQFRPPYIKESKFKDITYGQGFGHGTCTILYENADMYNLTTMYMKFLQGSKIQY